MGVRVVFPDMGKDPSIQLIEKTITENGTYNAITDGANGYSKVNVNVEGGGGGDFSTVTVTISPSSKRDGSVNLIIPFINDETLQTRLIFAPGEPAYSITVPVYAGYVKVYSTSPLATSGSITSRGDITFSNLTLEAYEISGNCSIG